VGEAAAQKREDYNGEKNRQEKVQKSPSPKVQVRGGSFPRVVPQGMASLARREGKTLEGKGGRSTCGNGGAMSLTLLLIQRGDTPSCHSFRHTRNAGGETNEPITRFRWGMRPNSSSGKCPQDTREAKGTGDLDLF